MKTRLKRACVGNIYAAVICNIVFYESFPSIIITFRHFWDNISIGKSEYSACQMISDQMISGATAVTSPASLSALS